MRTSMVVTVGMVGMGLMAAWGCGDEPQGFVDAAAVDAARMDGAAGDAAVDAPLAPIDAGIDAMPVLTAPFTFSPALGSLCGVGYDFFSGRVWIYPCNGATLHAFTTSGAAAGTLPRPGEAANDVDIAVAPIAITVGATSVAPGGLLFVNGETGVAEVHFPDTADATPLVTAFGNSHVVGGAFHPGRETLFLLQDNVPATSANTVAELDRTTGAVVGSFATTPAFAVSYGDLEICPTTGRLFVVSSIEPTIAELTPEGVLVAEHALPAEVSQPSGIALSRDGLAWIVGVGGQVWRIEGLPCGNGPPPS